MKSKYSIKDDQLKELAKICEALSCTSDLFLEGTLKVIDVKENVELGVIHSEDDAVPTAVVFTPTVEE